MAILKRKWLVVLIILVVIVIFETLSIQSPLSKRAVAVGIALDYYDEQVLLSAQIITPTAQKDKGNKYKVFSASGQTLEQAMSNLQTTLGLIPSFSHTVALVISKQFIQKKLSETFKTIMSSALISDNALVAVSLETDAKQVLESKQAVSELVPYSMQNSMQSDAKPLGITVTRVKDFFLNYYKVGGCSFFPVVSLIAEEGVSGGSAQEQEQEKLYNLDLSTCAVYDNNLNMLHLDKEMTLGLNIIKQKHKDGNFVVQNQYGQNISLTVISSQGEIEIENNEITFKVDLVVENLSLNNVADKKSERVTSYEKKQIEQQISKQIISAFEYGRANSMDIFNIGEEYYIKNGREWLDKKPDYLSGLQVKTKINVKEK